LGMGYGQMMAGAVGGQGAQQGAGDQSQTTPCAKCGTANAVGTRFCSNCGAPQQAAAAPTVECPSCHAQVQAGTKFCSECGQAMQRKCPSCNTEVQANTKFCPDCGAKL
ncbi:MAG TPA: zinc ribbon domain-containing protein, partial [Blastocatellia bacterium]|nr:zinc ribbon domain-containing protein [Blastocatellia bacterium]